MQKMSNIFKKKGKSVAISVFSPLFTGRKMQKKVFLHLRKGCWWEFCDNFVKIFATLKKCLKED